MNITELLFQALDRQKAGDFENAKALYRQVLEVAPRNPDAHHLLGCIFHRERRLDEAIISIGTAIAMAPGQPTFYNSLGACYKDKVENVAAELCFRHALALDPNYADAWSNLGTILVSAQRFKDALGVLQQANAIAPMHEPILSNLGWVYFELGQTEDALVTYKRAVEAHPESATALMGMAVSLNKLNQSGAALLLIDRVLALKSRFTDKAMQIKGMALEALGQIDEACACYDLALQSDPGSTYLMLCRANVRKVKREEAFCAHLLQFEAQGAQLRGSARTQLFYALGKVYQDLGDFAAAARNYAIGASSQLLNCDYNENDDIVRDAAIEECMTVDCLNILGHINGGIAGSASDRPIFILGMPRSGTTLVEQILASHPDVTAVGELLFANEVLDGAVLPGDWRLDFSTAHKLPASATFKERAEAYLKKVDAFSTEAQNRRFTDKMPANYLNLGLLLIMFPNARIIHCRRDPIDTCISCYNTLFSSKQYWSYDFGILGRTYRRYWSLMEHWRRVLPGRFLEVRYEQVVENTEQAARTLLDWCGLEWDPRVLNFHQTERQVMTASVGQVRQPIYTSSVGRWKKWEPYIQPLLAEIGGVEKQYWDELKEDEPKNE